MEKTISQFDHGSKSLLKALGVSKGDERLKGILIKVFKNEDLKKHSEFLECFIEEAKTPEELAFLAFKCGQYVVQMEDPLTVALKGLEKIGR